MGKVCIRHSVSWLEMQTVECNMNITFTHVFILSEWDCYFKLFFSDELCCACQQWECSVLVMFFFFPCWSFQSCFVFCPGISIQAEVLVDPVTGLSTTSSVLEYSAGKEDEDAQFTCSTQHAMGAELVSSPVIFTITCKSQSPANNHLRVPSAQTKVWNAAGWWLFSSPPQIMKS